MSNRVFAVDADVLTRALLDELVTDPSRSLFQPRMQFLGREMVSRLHAQTPVTGRHFRVVCSLVDLDGFAAGVKAALSDLGATFSIAVHFHFYRIVCSDPLIEVCPIPHAINEPDDRDATLLLAWSCIGSLEPLRSSLTSLVLDKKVHHEGGIVILSPVTSDDVGEKLAELPDYYRKTA